ncbi:SDR family NAD(P)-dependent oxidoreductase [Agitococcus lubricus]|uniref:Short-subunit dehydrogenase n=1 Tax=Agitococcus lubricus TaxID=1077255 RepID=A0A2T5IYR7_9GAMM|nr:SDR family NAD(P)-dependent oxidoreductase [Agitococcus lubricus]PTQ89152.1 short-subunit dehydrogenase [Agitococcus lubricus]
MTHNITHHKPHIWARALSWLANPKGLNNLDKLRNAVEGKHILLTGASFGIGEATAYRLANAGAILFLVARSSDKLQQVVAKIRAGGGQAYAYSADLSKPEQAKALIETMLAEHHYVDILINNAGKSIRRSIMMSENRFQDFERTMAINYLGPVQLVLALLPSMRARKQGHIINISTWGVRMPPGARWAAYQASKGAFDIWLRSVALEIKAQGIDTTSIYPAIVYTRMSAPTPWMHLLPGMTTDEAAHVIERAIVDKPIDIIPPFLRPGEVTSVLFPAPIRKGMQLVFKYSKDSEASIKSAQKGL